MNNTFFFSKNSYSGSVIYIFSLLFCICICISSLWSCSAKPHHCVSTLLKSNPAPACHSSFIVFLFPLWPLFRRRPRLMVMAPASSLSLQRPLGFPRSYKRCSLCPEQRWTGPWRSALDANKGHNSQWCERDGGICLGGNGRLSVRAIRTGGGGGGGDWFKWGWSYFEHRLIR